MKGLVFPGAILLLLMVGCARQPSPDAADIAANNRGVGLMGQYKYADALAVFEQLVNEHPDWLDVKVNLAIATLNRQEEGDESLALGLLSDVLGTAP
ncbi:MAG: hypothetical protein O7F17_06940, partial [Planctomycetota bacterium]|nr:hypothetical protein [Planctomycetota bacterium]